MTRQIVSRLHYNVTTYCLEGRGKMSDRAMLQNEQQDVQAGNGKGGRHVRLRLQLQKAAYWLVIKRKGNMSDCS